MTSSTYSRAHPSTRYRELLDQYKAMHTEGDLLRNTPPAKTYPGDSLPAQAKDIKILCDLYQAETLLDYGAGKGQQYVFPCVGGNSSSKKVTIPVFWGIRQLTCYDPAYEPFNQLPEGKFDGVINTDVLEHCPEQDVPWIVEELFSYARKFVFSNIAGYPAIRVLSNGENAHCTVRDGRWWQDVITRAAAKHPEVDFYFCLTQSVKQPDGNRRAHLTMITGANQKLSALQSGVEHLVTPQPGQSDSQQAGAASRRTIRIDPQSPVTSSPVTSVAEPPAAALELSIPVQPSAVANCPSTAEMTLALASETSPWQRGALIDHLQECHRCNSLHKELVEKIAADAGRILYKDHLVWIRDRSWMAPIKKYLLPDDRPERPTERILDRRFMLVQLAASVKKLPGSTAECGVLGGVGSAMICKTLEGSYQDGEEHFGFDSFEGLSEPEGPDRTQYAWQKQGALAIGPETAEELLADFPFCRLVKGWVPDSLAEAQDHRFRLVHLDMDLYRPTLESLRFFYDRMNPGGVFVFDDYGHLTCLGVREAVQEFFAERPESIIEIVAGQAVVFKGQAAAWKAAA